MAAGPFDDQAKIYVLGYVRARSTVTAQHRLPTVGEIDTLGTEFFGEGVLVAALKELVAAGSIHTDGVHYSTKPLAEYPL